MSQLDLDVLVGMDAVFQLDPFQLVRRDGLGSKSLRVATAGSLTKPSAIASAKAVAIDHVVEVDGLARRLIFGVAVSSRPSTGFSSATAFMPALAR